jgi:putative ABC transport system permease protein
MLQDVRFGWRTLRRSPGFAIGAICTLALGIGANTAIFSVINGVILRPLPYREPSRLVSVAEQLRKTGQGFSFSYLDFLDCQRATQSFESMAAIRGLGANVTSPGEPKYVKGALVSAGFLSVLGVKLYLGREFHADEDRPGAAPVAIISYALWRERFAGNPRAIGATLVAGGKGYAVVGVLPARFRYDDDRAVLTPIGQNDKIGTQKRDFH